MKEKIDWSKFKDKYVKLVTGAEKRLKLANWTDGAWFNKAGICFDAFEEDGVAVQKQFTVTGGRLIRALKPVIVRAEEDGRDIIFISILRTGEGLNTRYAVKELQMDLEEYNNGQEAK